MNKREYKTPNCKVVFLKAKRCLLAGSLTENPKNAKYKDDGGELD